MSAEAWRIYQTKQRVFSRAKELEKKTVIFSIVTFKFILREVRRIAS